MILSYAFSNGTTSSATVTFNVSGPTGNLVPNAFTATGNASVVIPTPTGTTMHMGNAQGIATNGVYINDLATLLQGSFIWIQIISSTTYSQLFTPTAGYNRPTNLGSGAMRDRISG